jgi:4-hydroxybenzoate polyprenyltransferase
MKDHDEDKAAGRKTLPVQFGRHNATLFIIVPLALLGLLTFILFAIKNNWSLGHIVLNFIPYILLLISAFFSLKNQRGIAFYLFVVDGLMMIKAVFGIVSMLLLK